MYFLQVVTVSKCCFIGHIKNFASKNKVKFTARRLTFAICLRQATTTEFFMIRKTAKM